MNKDIRLAVGFFDHPKTVKLERRLGWQGVKALLRLWFWASQYRPDGRLNGMEEEDIEIAAQWVNDSLNDRSTFVATLLELGWIDREDEYVLHDWQEHNGFASSATDRSDKSRFSRLAKTHPAIYLELKGNGIEAISAEDYKRLTTVQRPLTNRLSPSPAPSPAPLPSPKEKKAMIPDWVPIGEWKEFVEMRKKIKKPLTDKATKMAVCELERLKLQGHKPQDVLSQSVFNCWKGLFPIHERGAESFASISKQAEKKGGGSGKFGDVRNDEKAGYRIDVG